MAIEIPQLVCNWESSKNLLKLPRHKAIYFACDAEDRVLYVGRTLAREGLLGRWRTHHLKGFRGFSKRFKKLYWWEIPVDVTEIEIAMIQKYQPEYNSEYSNQDLLLPFDEEVNF